MSTERALYRTPIVVSVLLHMAVLVPVLMPREPPGLSEGTGGGGFAVSIATADGATGAPGTEAPDLETIDAGPNPDEVSATLAEPEEVAAEAEPETVAAAVVETAEPPTIEPDETDDSEPESVVPAASPEAAKPAPAPDPLPKADMPSEAAEVPLEEIQAQPPKQGEAPAETVETVAAEDSGAATKARETPAEKREETPTARSDPAEIAGRTTTTGETRDDNPARRAGDGGDGSSDSGSGAATIDSGARAGVTDYSFLLQAWLEKHKKYPRRAKLRHWQGTAMLHFTIDGAGNVLDYRIERSSGHAVLDEEVEAMIRRAAPLPPAPSEMQSARLEFVVPVEFSLE
jgi:protein TonB